MLLSYIIFTVLINMFLAYIWIGSTMLNVLLKMTFSSAAIFGVIILIQFAPVINIGSMSLI